jgi:hypothetical protein
MYNLRKGGVLMSQSGNTREGLYRIKVSWSRIKEELNQGRPKKQIYEGLKSEGLYNYSYQSFLKTLKSELKNPELKSPALRTVGETSETIPPKKKSEGAFIKPDLSEEKAKAAEVANKYLK